MVDAEQMSFHEASVVGFHKLDSDIELHLDDVLVDGKKKRIILNISQVSSVKIDGQLSSAPLLATNDGEILTLEISEKAVWLLIEWNDFSNKKSFTRSYLLSGHKVSVLMI